LTFGARAKWIRMRRFVSQIGSPRIGIVDHLTIPVHDLDAARAFYCGVLGAAYSTEVTTRRSRRTVGHPHQQLVWLGPTTAGWVVGAMGIVASLSGLVDWCPMCALAGRKLESKH
jgi:extradiol dioxygenase family protein